MLIPKKVSALTRAKLNWLRKNGGIVEVVKASGRHFTAVARLAEGKTSREAIVNDVEKAVKAVKFPKDVLAEITSSVAKQAIAA